MYNPLTKNINSEKLSVDYKGDLKRAMPTIDVAFVGKLITDVLGVENPVYLPTWWQGRDYTAGPYSVKMTENEEYFSEDSPVRFGNKVFGAFWIREGTYKMYESDGTLKSDKFSKFLMPVATVIDFSRTKKVLKTPTIGGLGSVKEVFSMEDWSISINGIILPDENNPPEYRTVAGQMNAIQKFHEYAGCVGVEGKVFADRNIVNIVTESLTFSPVRGKPNMMQYSIQATSDVDILMVI